MESNYIPVLIRRDEATAHAAAQMAYQISPKQLRAALAVDRYDGLSPGEMSLVAALEGRPAQCSRQIAELTGYTPQHVRRMLMPDKPLRVRGFVKAAKWGYELAR